MKRRDLMMSVAAISFSAALPAFAEDQHQSPIGFILVGASWCPFCKSASGTLFAAAVPAALPVLVASQDGHPIPPFPDFVDARGHPVAQTVTQIPTLLFVHLPSGSVIGKLDGFRNPRTYLNKIRATLLQAHEAGYV